MIGKTRGGNTIRTFTHTDTPTIPDADKHIPFTFVIVIAYYDDQFCLIHNIGREQWEIPGGGIEAGEHPDDTARRELMEEAGQHATQVYCRGIFQILFHNGKHEHGAIYETYLDKLAPFEINEEADNLRMWDANTPLPEVLDSVNVSDFSRIIRSQLMK